MIRKDLPKTEGNKTYLYCPYCNHEQKEVSDDLTFGSIIECENCGRATLIVAWLYEPINIKKT